MHLIIVLFHKAAKRQAEPLVDIGPCTEQRQRVPRREAFIRYRRFLRTRGGGFEDELNAVTGTGHVSTFKHAHTAGPTAALLALTAGRKVVRPRNGSDLVYGLGARCGGDPWYLSGSNS